MPLDRPTQAELVARTQADARSRIPGVEPTLRRNLVGVLSTSLAGAAHLLYGAISWMARQIIPDTADGAELERWADLHMAVARLPAAAATGTLSLTGTTGTIVPAATRFQTADGVELETDAEATLAAGAASVAVTAVNSGQTGNVVAAAEVSILSPIAGLDSSAVVAAGGVSGGADQETDEALRLRLREHLQQPPHGGADFDYRAWAKEVAGVTRAWVIPHGMGTGTVLVYFVRDEDASIIPDAGEVSTVQAYIDAARPVAVRELHVVAPVAVPLNFTISGQVTSAGADNAALREAIEASLADLIAREAEPGGTSATNGTLLISRIREAISVAAGEFDHTLDSPTADQTPNAGEIYTMGTITWA